MVTIKSFLALAAFSLGAAALPSTNVDAASVFKRDCPLPGGNCEPFEEEGSLECEWCCYSFTPPQGSLCHTHDSERCGDGDAGYVFHCSSDH